MMVIGFTYFKSISESMRNKKRLSIDPEKKKMGFPKMRQ
jgi:hypothetical protein